jgi:carbamoyltransferase
MNILGISDVTGNHSHSCIALLQDGQLTFALSQERISRVKNDSRFPVDAIQAALDYAGLRLSDIDCFACGYPPANYYRSLVARSKLDLLRSVLGVMIRRPGKLAKYLLPNYRKARIDPKGTNGLLQMGVPGEKFRFVDHHLAHVSAGYFSSDLDDCLAISYGGFAPHESGQNVAGAVYRCRGEQIEFLEDIPMYATGCYFSAVSVALGFKYMEQEGKTMGLAAMGDPNTCYDRLKRLTTRFEEGQWIPYSHWIDYVMSPRSDVFLSSKSGRRLRKILDRHLPQDLAAAAQGLWQENITAFVTYLLQKYGVRKLILSGGVFLNAQINAKITGLEGIEAVFVHPHPGDGSTAIGAAIEAHRQLSGHPVRLPLTDVGLGLEFADIAIENDLRRAGSEVAYSTINSDLPRYVAEQIASGHVIGWFQGREEYGPRSLGHRCILADPRHVEIRDRITSFVKGRGAFIPIAASCLAENGAEYFKDFVPTPFMTRVFRAHEKGKKRLAGALHADGTCRVQAIDQSSYPPFRRVLEHFFEKTGIPLALNTSLNRHGEPIVHRPLEAILLLKETALDELVIGSFSVKKAKA